MKLPRDGTRLGRGREDPGNNRSSWGRTLKPASLGRDVGELPFRDPVETALAAEQQFVRTLGGFVMGIAGGDLVIHERIPLSRFNFVVVHTFSPERRTAFFERALDHYFQRAIRPTFRVPNPVPAHVDSGLRALGFRPRPAPLTLLLSGSELAAPASDLVVRPATASEFDEILSLWTTEKERPELRTALDIVWHHPNPEERLTPMVAARDGTVVSAGILYEARGETGLHFIATRPGERGQGAASALVSGVFGGGDGRTRPNGFLLADSARLETGIVRLGFLPARVFTVYELPPEAELALPPVPAAGPPRWRPPRGGDPTRGPS